MKKFGKISRFILSFIISFSLFYSSYELSNSLATGVTGVSPGQFILDDNQPNVIKCSAPSDTAAPNFASYFNIPDGLRPQDPWHKVSPKSLNGNELTQREDIKYQILAKCNKNGEMKYLVGKGCDADNLEKCGSLELINNGLVRKHGEESSNNLMSYYKCNEADGFVENLYSNNIGSCENKDALSCVIKKSDPSTYAKDYKTYSNTNISSTLEEKIRKEINNEIDNGNEFYGLFFENANILQKAGNLWPFNSSVSKKIPAREEPYSFDADGIENADADGYFNVKCKYNKDKKKSFIEIISSEAKCPDNNYQYAKAVYEYDSESESNSAPQDNEFILKSATQVADRVSFAAEKRDLDDVVFIQSSVCNPIQCIINTRGIDPFYVDPTPDNLQMFTRKAVAEDYYVRNLACAKWGTKEEKKKVEVENCWEESVEREKQIERREERREEVCEFLDYFWLPWEECTVSLVVDHWYELVRWTETQVICSAEAFWEWVSEDVCIGHDYIPIPGEVNNLLNDSWDCKTSEGKVPFVHYNDWDLVATMQDAIGNRFGTAVPNRNLNSFYTMAGFDVKDNAVCKHEDWSSECPSPKVGDDGKSQCFRRKKGDLQTYPYITYERKWCSDDDSSQKGWINYHCDAGGKATIYSQKKVIDSGDAHPELDFIGDFLNDQKFYEEANPLHANNFTNLEDKSNGNIEEDVYNNWNLFRNYGTGCCGESNPEDCVMDKDIGQGFENYWQSLPSEVILTISGVVVSAVGAIGLHSGITLGAACSILTVVGTVLVGFGVTGTIGSLTLGTSISVPMIIFGITMTSVGVSCSAFSSIISFISPIIMILGGTTATIAAIISSANAERAKKSPGSVDIDDDIDYTEIQ